MTRFCENSPLMAILKGLFSVWQNLYSTLAKNYAVERICCKYVLQASVRFLSVCLNIRSILQPINVNIKNYQPIRLRGPAFEVKMIQLKSPP